MGFFRVSDGDFVSDGVRVQPCPVSLGFCHIPVHGTERSGDNFESISIILNPFTAYIGFAYAK